MIKEPSPAKLGVIAPTVAEARLYAAQRHLAPNHWVFIATPDDLLKVDRGLAVVTLGNWDSRPDYMDLRRVMRERDHKIVVGKKHG